MKKKELEYMAHVRNNCKLKVQTRQDCFFLGPDTLQYFIDGVMRNLGYGYDEKSKRYIRRRIEHD